MNFQEESSLEKGKAEGG